jgi:hypothetical protein
MNLKKLTGLLPAFNPIDCQQWIVSVTPERVAAIKKLGIGAERELVEIVPPTLLRPIAVFRGLNDRPNAHRWLCYVARPIKRYDPETGSREEPAPDRVFLVFVTDRAELYISRWELSDPDDPRLPEGYADRFAERLEYRNDL